MLYVLAMKNNLISLGQVLEKGYKMKLELENLLVIYNKKRTILKAHLSKNRTFKVEIQTGKYQCLSIVSADENWLWHLRYGHLNFRSLYTLSKEKMVIGLPFIRIIIL